MSNLKNLKQTKNLSDDNPILPAIPEKLYFTIGEVGRLCRLKPHVLRYWEQEFPQLHPTKRRGNRRYYQRKDVLLVRLIRELLYQQGYTIEGARQKLLAEQGSKPATTTNSTAKPNLKIVVEELEKVVKILETSV